MPLTELAIDSHWESGTDWQKISDNSAKAALSVSSYATILDRIPAPEISIKLSDNDEVHRLNKLYREKDRPTNVLSFPQLPKDMLDSYSGNDGAELPTRGHCFGQSYLPGRSKPKTDFVGTACFASFDSRHLTPAGL